MRFAWFEHSDGKGMCQDKSFHTYGNLERIIDWKRSGRKMMLRFWRKKRLAGRNPARCGPASRGVVGRGREKLPLTRLGVFLFSVNNE